MGRRPVRNFAPESARRARRKLGKTQEDVAEALGVKRTYYVAIENGQRQVGPQTLRQLAELLEVPPNKLTTTPKGQATLRDLREWAGLTQADVAAQLGAASTTRIAALERASTELRPDDITVLQAAYDASPVQLRRAWANSRNDNE
jgi:transcriptional regulator with XRE-family HTH domain